MNGLCKNFVFVWVKIQARGAGTIFRVIFSQKNRVLRGEIRGFLRCFFKGFECLLGFFRATVFKQPRKPKLMIIVCFQVVLAIYA